MYKVFQEVGNEMSPNHRHEAFQSVSCSIDACDALQSCGFSIIAIAYKHEPASTSPQAPTLDRSNRSDQLRRELERMSVDAVRLMMKSAYDAPVLQRFSPEFKSIYNGVPANIGRDALYDHFTWLSQKYPNQHTEVTDAVADVDERRGRAKVWMTGECVTELEE